MERSSWSWLPAPSGWLPQQHISLGMSFLIRAIHGEDPRSIHPHFRAPRRACHAKVTGDLFRFYCRKFEISHVWR